MRTAFSKTIVGLATKNPDIVLMTGDHGYSLFDEFRRLFPEQFINAGIAEQNMVGMAAGLARLGYRPFVYGLSAFIPVKAVEQIKIDIAQDNLPVVLFGDGAGFVYSHLGTSHQSNEDVACTRSLPSMTVLSPCDSVEMAATIEYAYNLRSPVYLRMGKADLGDVHIKPVLLDKCGGLLELRRGRSSAPGLIATGSMVMAALEIGNLLNLNVWSAPIIKPLSKESVLEAASYSSSLVTIEEHSVYGGLGSAVSEIISEFKPTRLLRLGVPDKFSLKCGSYSYLLKEHGLDVSSLINKITEFSST